MDNSRSFNTHGQNISYLGAKLKKKKDFCRKRKREILRGSITRSKNYIIKIHISCVRMKF